MEPKRHWGVGKGVVRLVPKDHSPDEPELAMPGGVLRRLPSQNMAELRREALDCADALFDLASYLTGNPADAEDLVQETYARAFAALGGFARGMRMKPWLLRILRNTLISQWRHRGRDPFAHASTAEPSSDDLLPGGDLELQRMKGVVARDIERALMDLPEDARTVVLLDLEGLTEAEMAHVMDCAPGTIKSRLFRARAALRKRLSDYAK